MSNLPTIQSRAPRLSREALFRSRSVQAYAEHLRPLLAARPHLADHADEIAALAASAFLDCPAVQDRPAARNPFEVWVRSALVPDEAGRLIGSELVAVYARHHGQAGSGPVRRGRGDGRQAALLKAALANFPEARPLATVAKPGLRPGRGLAGLALRPDTSEQTAAPLAQVGAALPVSAVPRVEGAALAAALAVGQSADTPEKGATAGVVAGACLASAKTMDGGTL